MKNTQVSADRNINVNVFYKFNKYAIIFLFFPFLLWSCLPQSNKNNTQNITNNSSPAFAASVTDVGVEFSNVYTKLTQGVQVGITVNVINKGNTIINNAIFKVSPSSDYKLVAMDSNNRCASLDSGSCSISSLQPGESKDVTLNLVPLSTKNMKLGVSVSTNMPEDYLDNNKVQEDIAIISPAELHITTQNVENITVVGDHSLIPLVVENTGDQIAKQVILHLSNISEVTYHQLTVNNVICNINQDLTCNLGDISAGQTINLLLEASLNKVTEDNLQLSLSTDSYEFNQNNNTIAIKLIAQANADIALSFVKQIRVLKPGGSVTYDLQVKNNGPTVSAEIPVSIGIPGKGTIEVLGSDNYTCKRGNNLVCNINALDNNSDVLLKLKFTANGPGVASIDAQLGEAGTTYKDPDSSNNQTSNNILIGDTGIISFDSADPSIIFKSSLTSKEAIINAGGIESPGSDNKYDSILGMKPVSTATGVGGCRFSSDSLPALSDLPEGQISIEVEREWLAATLDSNPPSIGYTPKNDEYLISFKHNDLTAKVYKTPRQDMYWFFADEWQYPARQFQNSGLRDRFARFTISWTKKKVQFFVDGLKVRGLQRSDNNSTNLQTIYIASLLEDPKLPFKGDYYIRDLIVSSKPVKLYVPPVLKHIEHFGDSFAVGQPYMLVSPVLDLSTVNTVMAKLTNEGIGFGDYSVISAGGHQIQNNGNLPLLDYQSGAIQKDPSIVVFITGGNDIGIFDEATFTNDLHGHIEAFLGVNSNPPTNVKHMIVTTTASNNFATSVTVEKMVEIMNDLPKWWDNTYPDKKGRVHVIDMWKKVGGGNVDHSYFGLVDTVHPNNKGWRYYGNNIADAINDIITNQ